MKCYVRKARFPAAVEQDEKSQSLVWVSTPQRDNLFCFLFSGTIIVGLNYLTSLMADDQIVMFSHSLSVLYSSSEAHKRLKIVNLENK